MFTGITECIGTIISKSKKNGCQSFCIESDLLFDDLKIGDSIAVNGVCLTVTSFANKQFNIDAVPETLRLTNLGQLESGSIVNLERSLTISTRMGGHFVQGHIDTTTTIKNIESDNGEALMYELACPAELQRYIVKKGYICIDGMSLTVVECHQDSFKVTLIPHTQSVTIAKQYQTGHLVNLEVDLMAKQIEKLIGVQ